MGFFNVWLYYIIEGRQTGAKRPKSVGRTIRKRHSQSTGGRNKLPREISGKQQGNYV